MPLQSQGHGTQTQDTFGTSNVMRITWITVVLLAAGGALWAQPVKGPRGERYGISAVRDVYPQATPQETLASVVKAINGRRMDYVLAQLADPDYVDQRVRDVHNGRFSSMVDEATEKLAKDPGTVSRFRRYLKEGEWDAQDTTAVVRLKDRPDIVAFRKVGQWWYMNNPQRLAPETKEK
jgi:hypothetical protein